MIIGLTQHNPACHDEQACKPLDELPAVVRVLGLWGLGMYFTFGARAFCQYMYWYSR